jgi:hypothetical protein
MGDQENNRRKDQEEETASVPNHWEPVPGQALAAEEIERLKKEAAKKRKGGKDNPKTDD